MSARSVGAVLVVAFVVAAILAVPSCSSSPVSGRVLVLGLDGMDPRIVDLLMSEGRLPNFAKLRQQGAYAPLTSAKPLLSPVVWTTIATGKTPDLHRIGHFVAINQQTGEQLPVTSRMRKVRALWNILSEAGRSVSIVGYWATWPAETVKGSIVSDHLCYHFLFKEGIEGGGESA
ncbi:MAG: alkaline phosphatase family protein, partial [Thermoplasmata archaeon]